MGSRAYRVCTRRVEPGLHIAHTAHVRYARRMHPILRGSLTAAGTSLVLLSFAACGGGDNSGSGGSGASSTGGNATGGASTGGSQTGGSSTGGGGSGPGCSSLADAIRVTHLTVSTAATSYGVITAQRGDGSIVAWAGGDGLVHVLPLDANDAAAGAELTVPGDRVFGAAATADDVALLVARPPDFMTFTRIDLAGQTLASADLVGGGDHNTVGVEWFGEFAQTGRLVAQSDGSYAAYHALHRRWPDNIGHQGDTLRLLGKDGSAQNGGWDWGCSHSIDQRLAVGPTGLVPICVADCYPGKGIYFRHDAAQITEDPGANCAGGVFTALGGLVAVADGFFLVYQDDQGGAHLGHYDAQGALLSTRALGEPGTSRLALYEDGLLIGIPANATTGFEKLDSNGEPTGEKTGVVLNLPDQDFESRTDGEVAWATAAGTDITVVRVKSCP